MKKITFLSFVLIFVVFRSWFLPHPLSAGDWSFNFTEAISKFYVYPFVWNSKYNYGMGDSIAFILPLETYFLSTVHILNSIFKLPWVLIERIISFWLFLVVSISTSAYLFKKMFPQNKFWFFSSLIFLFNTYALMLVGGGQMGVAMGYALAPLVLCAFINVIDLRLKTYDLRTREKNLLKSYILNLKFPLVAGLVLALQVMFDARIAYVTMVAVGIYLICLRLPRQLFRSFLAMTGPIVIAVLLHFFWILPLVLAGQNPISELGSAYSSSAAVKFLSFADFSHSLSLLHPNWPENIFGKVYFMRTEFLLLPILAFSSLLFINGLTGSRVKKFVLFFALIGLIGAFLAKGANLPFGEIYVWLFKYLPGFNLFRDSTKWYTLIAISYSVLIPYSISMVYGQLKARTEFLILNFKFLNNNKIFNAQNIFVLSIICYLLFLIHPAILGQLTGTFKPRSIPTEYIDLKDFLYSQPQFFRTLWVPTTQRFGFNSNNHPMISGQGIFKVTDTTGVIKQLSGIKNEQFIQELGVKYVIVPFDSEAEIFLKERKYDNEQYKNTISGLGKISWLRKIGGFGKLAVFEVHPPAGGSKDHFWIDNSKQITDNRKQSVKYKVVNPTKYEVQVTSAQKGQVLVFSESYDKGWKAQVIESKVFKVRKVYKVDSEKYNGLLNSFVLPESGSYTLEIYYEPQKWVNIGMVISGPSLILCILFLLYSVLRRPAKVS